MKGDFTGFKINGIHCSDLGITRIADGDRYDEALVPDLEDKTVDIPGNDGSYYYGSYFKPREFKINVAFDHLTEEQFRRLRLVVSNRNLFPLVFDEAPYKVYTVKASAPPEFHYICFDEEIRDTENVNLGAASALSAYDDNHDPYLQTIPQDYSGTVMDILDELPEERSYRRIYKGEGDLTFTAYYPYAHTTKEMKAYDATYYNDYNNVDEWVNAAKLKSTSELSDYDQYNEESGYDESGYESGVIASEGQIKVYNPGDIAASFKLYIPFTGNIIPATTIQLQDKNGNDIEGYTLMLDQITKENESSIEHTGIMVNTKNELVEGALVSANTTIVDSAQLVYNEYATMGNFFKIPATDGRTEEPFEGYISITGASGDIIIDYEYLYF